MYNNMFSSKCGSQNSQHKSLKGFTLAEVLVTLGIIGVVSAMTIPTLTKNHQKQVFTTQLRKVYSEFTQAGESYINSKNAVNMFEAGVSSQAGLENFITSSMKIVKSCGSNFTSCFANEYKNMTGETVSNYSNNSASCYALADGASVCLEYNAPIYDVLNGRYRPFPPGVSLINIVVDVNGKNGPNVIGRDLFAMGTDLDGSIIFHGALPPEDEAERNTQNVERCRKASAITTNGGAALCFGEILDNNWKMDY